MRHERFKVGLFSYSCFSCNSINWFVRGGQGKLSISQATADDAERTVHADIVKVEQTLSLVEFDLSKKAHLLRKTRLDFYVKQAKQADLRGWKFKRDEFVERAENILSHHLSQYANDIAQETESYTAQAI